MSETRQPYEGEGQYAPQQMYNSYPQFQSPTHLDPTLQTTSQNSMLSPQYNYPSNYYISYDPSQYVSSSEYPVDWNTYNTAAYNTPAQYYSDNCYYYPPSYQSTEGADSDTKLLEQSFNHLNLSQFPSNSQLINYSMQYPKQFLPNNTNNKWDPKRIPDPSRSASSRYWMNEQTPLPQQNQLPSQYNPPDFNHNLDGAKYFVIKSYSEEDIFRSIKYNVWCSTEYGNKRLNSAYISKPDNACVYLFYSVNGSGHFCGVAMMTSAVDFNLTSKVWMQNKWKGQFSVKWLYVKDVPNNPLRHIRLENNENKPVTNSRDTQEVPPDKGRHVLHILHHFKHHSSIFQDFPHYEQRLQAEQWTWHRQHIINTSLL